MPWPASNSSWCDVTSTWDVKIQSFTGTVGSVKTLEPWKEQTWIMMSCVKNLKICHGFHIIDHYHHHPTFIHGYSETVRRWNSYFSRCFKTNIYKHPSMILVTTKRYATVVPAQLHPISLGLCCLPWMLWHCWSWLHTFLNLGCGTLLYNTAGIIQKPLRYWVHLLSSEITGTKVRITYKQLTRPSGGNLSHYKMMLFEDHAEIWNKSSSCRRGCWSRLSQACICSQFNCLGGITIRAHYDNYTNAKKPHFEGEAVMVQKLPPALGP